ncbi:MAG: hypothetical protein HDT22_09105 [Ruminococcus sp.]|nr:hypothetical protein [Ruminococcus sp.]
MRVFQKNILAIIIGCLVGIVTLAGQAVLPVNLNFLANSGAIWLIPAFLFSFFSKNNQVYSMLITINCLFGCVYGYYISEAIHNNHAFDFTSGVYLWTVMAILAGSIFGIGAYFANQENHKIKYYAKNLLPAVFTAEGIENLIHISDYSHMIPAVIMKIIIGILLYFVINKQDSMKSKNLFSFGMMTILGIIAYTGLFLFTCL